MPFTIPDDEWVEIPSCRYRVGLEPDEIDRLAEISAARSIAGFEEVADQFGDEIVGTVRWEYGSVDWVRRKLQLTCYAYDVELPAFRITRRPVSNAQYRAYLAEVGGDEPKGWAHAEFSKEPDAAVRGVTWDQACAFAAWAGARLPFEAEWERAARGLWRRLFPWGDDDEIGGRWLGRGTDTVFHPGDEAAMATPEGILGMVSGRAFDREWCADLRSNPSALGALARHVPDPATHWGRATRGSSTALHPMHFPPHTRIIPSAASRTSDLPDGTGVYSESIGFRLVQADGRSMPAMPANGPWASVAPKAIALEDRAVRPVMRELRESLDLHRVYVLDEENHARVSQQFDPPEEQMLARRPVERLISHLHSFTWGVQKAARSKPERMCGGDILMAMSLESIRRILPAAGIFLWQTKYRIGPEAKTVHAHPAAVFRMQHDRETHYFHGRFVPDQHDTLVEHVTPEMVRRSILEMFAYYDDHADADRPAPPPAGWIETTEEKFWEEWWAAQYRR